MKITIHNLHIDIFAGKVPRSTYNYFAKKSKITLTQYIPIGFWGDIDEMPLKYQFIRQGQLGKACNLWTHRGIILDGATKLVITQDDKEIYTSTLMDWENQLHPDIKFKSRCIRLEDSSIKSNQAVFVATMLSIGLKYKEGRRFFEGEIKNAHEFDPKKLKVYYKDVLGTRIIEKVVYDGKKIKQHEEDFSTWTEFQKAWWYLPNGEIPYDFRHRFAYERFSKAEWFRQDELNDETQDN